MALSLAMCQLLLGDTAAALQTLREDERVQLHLVAAQQRQQQARGWPLFPGVLGVWFKRL